MSIEAMAVYVTCPECGQVSTYMDYHENTSSDRGECFLVLNSEYVVCQHCNAQLDTNKVLRAQYASVEDPKRYQQLLRQTLIRYCKGEIRFISFSDWELDITGPQPYAEQRPLQRLRAMYPTDFYEISQLYRNVRTFGKDYLNKLETGSRIVSREQVLEPECLRKVYLRDGVEIIGKESFCDCRSLWDIYLPDSVTQVEDDGFRNAGLKTAHTSSRLQHLGCRAFADCNRLEKLFLPDSLQVIADQCFSGCSALRVLHIPPCADLGQRVFENCRRLERLELPSRWKQDTGRLAIPETAQILWYD